MNTTTTTNPNIQLIADEMQKLIDEAKKVNTKVDEVNKASNEQVTEIESRIDGTINELETIYSDLDKAKKNAGDKLDEIAIKEAKDIADDE